MSETKIQFTIYELEQLLTEQKELVVNRLSQNTYVYNTESTEGHMKTLSIDKEKFIKYGMGAGYPNKFDILKKHIL